MRLIVLSLLLISLSLAATVQVSGTVAPSGSTSMLIKTEIPDSWDRPVSLNISGPIKSVVVKDRSGLELESRLVNEGNRSIISATVPSDYIEFIIVSDSFTAKTAGLWDFDLSLGMSVNIDSLNASLRLPPGARLKSTNGAVEGEGNSLLISWKAQDIDTTHQAHLKAGYELVGEELDLTLFAIGAVVLAAIAAYGIIKGRGMKPTASPPSPVTPPPAAPNAFQPPTFQPPSPQPALESNAVFKTLDETDKDIIREIVKQGGKTTQAYLYLNTHVPKATLSRRLASLENRGIIAKSQKGNRNLITLTDIIKK